MYVYVYIHAHMNECTFTYVQADHEHAPAAATWPLVGWEVHLQRSIAHEGARSPALELWLAARIPSQ